MLLRRAPRRSVSRLERSFITNAAKYNLPQGCGKVSDRTQQQAVVLTLANATQPFTVDEASRLFDRFYRGDPTRAAQTEGLSLAREIARAHGGALALAPSQPGEASFNLHLPLDP